MVGWEQEVVVASRCILEKEVHGTRIEVDTRALGLGLGLHNVAVVAVLDNKDLQLEEDSFAGNKVRQQPSKQRVLEN